VEIITFTGEVVSLVVVPLNFLAIAALPEGLKKTSPSSSPKWR